MTRKMTHRTVTLGILSLSFGALSCSDGASFQGSTPQPGVQSPDAQKAANPDGSDGPDGKMTDEASTDPAKLGSQRNGDRPGAIEAEFPVGLIKRDVIKIDLGPKESKAEFALTNIEQKLTEDRHQIARPARTEVFKQGSAGMALTQEIPQTEKKGLVDILVVIDNSRSMSQEQTNLGTKLSDLLASLTNTQWQVGVITTSPGTPVNGVYPCSMTLIRSTDADATTRFQTAVNAGIAGDGNEQGILQAVVGLGCPSTPWVRPNSSVAVLIVSDEDNCSNGADCGSNPWGNETYLINYVEGTMKRTVGVNAGFYGIFSPPASPCSTADNVGNQYQRLVNYKATGVNYGNICDASYKTTLNRISANISTLLSNQFELSDAPSPNTLSLTIRQASGQKITLTPGDFSVLGKTVTFSPGKEPALGSTIIASYRTGVVPTIQSINLVDAPAAGTLQISINGTALPMNGYTVNGKSISFATKPADLADIRVDYRLDTPLTDRFKLTQAPVNNSLTVLVNGNPTSAFQYDRVQNQVVMNPVPSDSAKISFAYNYIAAPQLSYSLPIMAEAQGLKVLDGPKTLAFRRVDQMITINAADHQVGKKLTLQYIIPDGAPRQFPLAGIPMDGSVHLESSGSCSLNNGVEIQGATMTVTCPVTKSTTLSLDYHYYILQRTFKLPSVATPDQGSWKILVNDVETTDFRRQGSSVTLNFEPDPEAKILINYQSPES